MRKGTFWTPVIPLLLSLCLAGCTGTAQENQLALDLRTAFLSMEGCSGAMEVEADYGQRVYQYTVAFSGTQAEGLTLVITAPQEVAGITAHVAEGQTWLTFDGVRLETGPLNQEGLSPLDALPAFLTAMQSGCIAESGSEWLGEREAFRLCCRDPAEEPGQGLETVLWFDKEEKTLLQGELRSAGSTVVRCVFSSFILTETTTEKG